jgi:hypothetical protein
MFLIQVVTSWYTTPANNSYYPCLSSITMMHYSSSKEEEMKLVMEFSPFTYQIDYMQFLTKEAANCQEY